MLEVLSSVTPSVEQWQSAIEGMRRPMKSVSKYDSFIANTIECINDENEENCKQCPYNGDYEKDGYSCSGTSYQPQVFILGKEDKRLLLNLCSQGDASHRKVLRQLSVQLEINAPLYWWKQMDQYRISTTTNSESTMHTLVKNPFEIYDFSVENLYSIEREEIEWGEVIPKYHFETTLMLINQLRTKYLKTNDKKYWYALNEILPQSYEQVRLWSGNYENLINIINQRKGHRLPEWDCLIDYLMKNVPYLKEIYQACQSREKAYKKLIEENKELKKKLDEYATAGN